MSNINFFKHESSDVSDKSYIGENTKIWHFSHVRENVDIGKKVTIGQNVYIDEGVKIGDNCKIQNAAQIYDGVTIKNNVFIGPAVVFTNDYFPRADNKNWEILKTKIDDGASIGANATILCGIKIGKHAMIGAGSVVIKDVEDYALYAGNPAKFIKKIKKI